MIQENDGSFHFYLAKPELELGILQEDNNMTGNPVYLLSKNQIKILHTLLNPRRVCIIYEDKKPIFSLTTYTFDA